MKQTDNSHYVEKRKLREEAAKYYNGKARILDCFAGEGLMWRGVDIKSIIQIEREKCKNKRAIVADNRKVLQTIDLSKFDIIDLDDYGVPFEQLETIFKKKFKGRVLVTAIASQMGKLPFRMLEKVGITREMYSLAPIACSLLGMEALFTYLANNGVDELYGFFIKEERKYYFSFDTKGNG